jgi:isoleucyl-tRNA synthetase
VNTELIDEFLAQQMTTVRNVVELGRTARAESKTKTRQPLARALISSAAWAKLTDELKDQIAAELNVKSLDVISSEGSLVSVSVKGNFKELGKKHGANTQHVATAIAAEDAAALVEQINSTGIFQLMVNGAAVPIEITDLIVTETPSEGWSVASSAGHTVALDLNLSAELISEGLAREVVRFIQDSRKLAGFDVTDRITVGYKASLEMQAAIEKHNTAISSEVLAVSFSNQLADTSPATAADAELGLQIWLVKA